jgi:hypothetical protein
MASVYTAVQDVVVPDRFVPYVIERTPQLTAFFLSGIIDMNDSFAELAGQGGATVNMPFWEDLQGNSQVLSDTAGLDTKKIGSNKDVAVIHNRGDAWKVNDLSKHLSGDDPLGTIGDLVANYWARDHESTTIATCQGVFDAANMNTNSLDISLQGAGAPGEDNFLLGPSFIDAKGVLGDNDDKLVAIAMHSASERQLRKADLIDFIPASQGQRAIKQFQDMEVIVDDSMPISGAGATAKYETYLFGLGAIALGVDPTDEPIKGGFGTYQLEYSREATNHNSLMINRRRFILHPRGVKWLGAEQEGLSPTDAELAEGTNWTRVYDPKNVRLVRVIHNVG